MEKLISIKKNVEQHWKLFSLDHRQNIQYLCIVNINLLILIGYIYPMKKKI